MDDKKNKVTELEECVKDIQDRLSLGCIAVSNIKDFRVLTDVNAMTGMLFINFDFRELTHEKTKDI